MGMPRALGAIRTWAALLLMAPLALLGATFASHAVEHTVAHGLTTSTLGRGAEVVVVAVAFGLTTAYNRLRIPTSTIQILVSSVAGTALGAGVGVRWASIGALALVWVLAPLVAAGLGFALTKVLDRVLAWGQGAERPAGEGPVPLRWLGPGLVVVGAAASFTLGSNDVANATGSLVAAHLFSPLVAGAVGGAGLALGVITAGRPLLERVAFDIVRLDRSMATAAQAVQAAVVLLAASLGLFTSMNQALVGAMAGAGMARGTHTVRRETLVGILRGWVLGPAAGLAAGFVVAKLAAMAGAPL
jgi:PiT family inorganic phosphate transporter